MANSFHYNIVIGSLIFFRPALHFLSASSSHCPTVPPSHIPTFLPADLRPFTRNQTSDFRGQRPGIRSQKASLLSETSSGCLSWNPASFPPLGSLMSALDVLPRSYSRNLLQSPVTSRFRCFLRRSQSACSRSALPAKPSLREYLRLAQASLRLRHTDRDDLLI